MRTTEDFQEVVMVIFHQWIFESWKQKCFFFGE